MSSSLRVVGISGKIGSGKTEVAKHLIEERAFIADSIAMDIKLAVAKMTGTSLDDNKKRKDMVSRGQYEDGEVCVMTLGEHQVLYGKKQRALHGDDIFVRRLWDRIVAAYSECCDAAVDVRMQYVIDDVRLKCEAEFLSEKGATLIRLERSPKLRAPFMVGRDPTDITEVGLDDYPFEHVLQNDGTKDELFAAVDVLLEHV